MDIETAREYCLAKKAVTECLPFDEYSLVMKVMDKMFVLIHWCSKWRGRCFCSCLWMPWNRVCH